MAQPPINSATLPPAPREAFDPLRNARQMASLISQVTGEPVESAMEKLDFELHHPGRTVARAFAAHGGKRYVWSAELESFYGSTDSFLYELAIWNRNALKSRLRRYAHKQMRKAGKPMEVLSIGDGLGFDSLFWSRKGEKLTYFELPGISERFARALFARAGEDIAVETDPQKLPREAFDAVTCFDVLEHVPDPPAMVQQLASYLRPGGLLMVSAPFFMIFPWYPTHLRANRRYSGSAAMYKKAGLKLVGGRWDWYPIVFQKSGGPPATRNATACLAIGLTGALQAVGRFTSLPFLPIHLLRRLSNRTLSAK